MTARRHDNSVTPPGPDRHALRRALGAFVTGVTIVTTMDRDGNHRGFTANSFTSVSLQPPLVLICVDRTAHSHEAFTSGTGVGIHVLAHDQEELASRFATKAPNKFAKLECRTGVGGAPLFSDCAAWLDCEVTECIELGDHTVVVGKVRDFAVADRRPLAFLHGRFISLAPEIDSAPGDSTGSLVAGWLAGGSDGRVVLKRVDGPSKAELWTIPETALGTASLDDASLCAAAETCLGLPASIEFLYSIFDDPTSQRVMLIYRIGFEMPSPVGLSPPLAGFAIDELPWSKIWPRTVRVLLRRYERERKTARFGLYAGSADRGRLAIIEDVALDD